MGKKFKPVSACCFLRSWWVGVRWWGWKRWIALAHWLMLAHWLHATLLRAHWPWLRLIVSHSLTLVHNSFLFSKTWNNIPAMCSRLWSLKCWGRSLIITFLIIFLNKFPRCKFHAWFRKIQVVPGEPRKTQTLESNCNKLQNSDVLGKRETFQSPSFFFWESASWIESAGMWRVNIRQNWKDIALDMGPYAPLNTFVSHFSHWNFHLLV